MEYREKITDSASIFTEKEYSRKSRDLAFAIAESNSMQDWIVVKVIAALRQSIVASTISVSIGDPSGFSTPLRKACSIKFQNKNSSSRQKHVQLTRSNSNNQTVNPTTMSFEAESLNVAETIHQIVHRSLIMRFQLSKQYFCPIDTNYALVQRCNLEHQTMSNLDSHPINVHCNFLALKKNRF